MRGWVIQYELLCCLMIIDDSVKEFFEVISLALDLGLAGQIWRSKFE